MSYTTFMHGIFDTQFVFALCSIMLVNIILSGDNAVVIAMSVKSLPKKQRRQGILFGTGVAVLLRIGLTFVAAQLLNVGFMKLAGGLFIAWIAIKLFVDGAPGEQQGGTPKSLGKAIFTILAADLVMSVDNVLAVAGASKGNIALLVIGLATSIPLVIFASGILSRLMERYRFITYVGAAVLGRVAGEMIMTDPVMARFLPSQGHLAEYAVEALFAAGVVMAGRLLLHRRPSRLAQAPAAINNPFALPNWDIV